MFTDHEILYLTVNVPRMPIIPGVEWPSLEAGNSRVQRHGEEILTDETLEFMRECDLRADAVLLWAWGPRYDNRRRYVIHSDGYWDNPNQRQCAMNWHISGHSRVEFWSYDGATPERTLKDEDQSFQVTRWVWPVGEPRMLGTWMGKSPAVVNIKQPHSVCLISHDHGPRISVTIRFNGNPSIEEMMQKLSNRVTSVVRPYV